MRPVLIGEAGRFHSANIKIFHLSFRWTLPLSAGSDVAPIIFLCSPISWHYVAHTASPICPELACKLGSTDRRKRKYSKHKMKANKNKNIMPSTMI
jgi:hypothetical protein